MLPLKGNKYLMNTFHKLWKNGESPVYRDMAILQDACQYICSSQQYVLFVVNSLICRLTIWCGALPHRLLPDNWQSRYQGNYYSSSPNAQTAAICLPIDGVTGLWVTCPQLLICPALYTPLSIYTTIIIFLLCVFFGFAFLSTRRMCVLPWNTITWR